MKSGPVKTARYSVWSTKAIVLASLPMVVLTVVLVFALSRSPAWVEWQLTLLVVAAGLFAFLSIGLYRGVRLQRPKQADGRVDILAVDSIPPLSLDPNVSGFPDTGGDDLLGCLVSLVVWVVVTLVLAVVAWLVVQALIVLLPVALLGIYWVYYRALRVVFAKSRACKGNLPLSLGYSLLYTVLYTGWLFAVLWLGHFVLQSLRAR